MGLWLAPVRCQGAVAPCFGSPARGENVRGGASVHAIKCATPKAVLTPSFLAILTLLPVAGLAARRPEPATGVRRWSSAPGISSLQRDRRASHTATRSDHATRHPGRPRPGSKTRPDLRTDLRPRPRRLR